MSEKSAAEDRSGEEVRGHRGEIGIVDFNWRPIPGEFTDKRAKKHILIGQILAGVGMWCTLAAMASLVWMGTSAIWIALAGSVAVTGLVWHTVGRWMAFWYNG